MLEDKSKVDFMQQKEKGINNEQLPHVANHLPYNST